MALSNMDLSICTTIKNRSYIQTKEAGIISPFEDYLVGLNKALLPLKYNVELVIADWKSTDCNIKEVVEKHITAPISIHIITVEGSNFSIGQGRNIAADHSGSNVLFFIDADTIICSDVLKRGTDLLTHFPNSVFYPAVRYQTEYNGKSIIHQGGGNLFITKDNFNKIGKWPEYMAYGWEDIDFTKKIKQSNIDMLLPHSTEGIHLYHPWHPKDKTVNFEPTPEQQQVVDNREKYYKKEIDKEMNALKIYIKNKIENNPRFIKEKK